MTQETGASEKLSTQTGSFSITPENSGYNIGPIEATGSENQAHVAGDGKIQRPCPWDTGFVDSDGSEEIVSVTLSGVPTDYIVYIGNEMAQNVGGGAWSIKLTEDGKIPGNISILPKEYDSGTYNLSLNIFTKETERNDIEEDNVTITLKVDPVASGVRIDPTKTFGETGKPISLNLNAEMHDLDGSETMSLSLTGLPEVVTFNHGEASSSYDTDSDTWTWTITGIAHDVINDLTFTTATAFSGTVEVKAWTVEGNDSESEKVAGTFNVSVEDSEPIGDIHCLGLTSAVSIPARVRKAMVRLPHPWLTAPPPRKAKATSPLPTQVKRASPTVRRLLRRLRTFPQSGESGSGGQEWGSSSPSLQDGEGASHGSDWDAASGNSGSGNSGDESHTSFHDGSSDLGAGSDVIPAGSGPETSSGGDSGPEGQGRPTMPWRYIRR